ncbi:GAF domain-containing SpoIIE family protein phosphatase [Streptomyces sp. NPDC047123]|uniref:PP2C family protein-serine/threonine phosphatase n=1 Tax=Streptomyces sp. NPDC047123 TaxID=3155622 RepID=UPI0033E48818
MERFARLTAGVLGASGAVVAVAVPLPDGGTGVEVTESWPPELSRTTPELAELLLRTARGDGLLVTGADAEVNSDAAQAGYKAFAGIPVRDEHGELLGALAAVDVRARPWTGQNTRDLAALAGECSTELALRSDRPRRRGSRPAADQARREAASATRPAPGEESAEPSSGLDRSDLLLRAAELLADTSGLDEVRRTVSVLVSGDLRPAYVGLVLREDGEALRRAVDTTSGPVPLEKELPLYGISDAWPSARAARENRIVCVPDRQALIDEYAPQTVEVFDTMGLQTAVCVPLPGTRRATLGTLVVAWDEPHHIDLYERAVLTVMAGYTARAVERALHLDERISVAHQLQQAMLTDLPEAAGLEMAALYRPAADGHMVGGDWYDAYRLPGALSGNGRRAPMAVTVGDVTGHNMRAAALMGQVRSMLRQADVERTESPASAVSSVERANEHLGTGISGTLVHAHLLPRPRNQWLLRWTNAGHPAPLLARPGRDVEYLVEHARLLYPGLTPPQGRPVHERTLGPGAVLLLYTDGLVEHHGHDVDQATGEAARLLARATAETTPLPQLLDLLADTLAGHEHGDDVVLLAVRVKDTDEG